MANSSQELAAAAAAVNSGDLGEKVRVHALAKALGIPSSQMITVLGEHGVENKRAASTVPRVEVERILGELVAAGQPAGEKPAKKTGTKPAKKTSGRAGATTARSKKEPAESTEPAAPAEQVETGETQAADGSVPRTGETRTTGRRARRSTKVTRKAAVPTHPVDEVTVDPVQRPAAADTPQPADTAGADESAGEGAATGGTSSSVRRRRRRRVSRPAGQDVQSSRGNQDGRDDRDNREASAGVSEPEQQPEQQKSESAAVESRPLVRRRIIRRVGSRSAAAGAEELRRERQRDAAAASAVEEPTGGAPAKDQGESSESSASSRRRRGSRGRGRGRGDQTDEQQANDTVPADASDAGESTDQAPAQTVTQTTQEQTPVVDEPVKLKGSTRLESKRRWRQEQGNEKHRVVTRAEFIARRENIFRSMVVRDARRKDGDGWTTQVGVVEDGLLVEHFVTSDDQQSTIGNIYLGRVQNVLSSMEAAFIDIGTGRNAVLYASEVDWRSEHVRGRSRRIESALKQGDQVLVQVIKEPLGHKGARLTNRVSFAGRYLVYVPGGRTQGISRKLPEAERKRLKSILQRVVPGDGGTIIRTAAEGVSEDKIAEDVDRLHRRWLEITERENEERAKKGATPVTLYEEPNLLVKVVRDMFNEDFNELVVDGRRSWQRVRDYVHRMAPDLENRVVRWNPEEHGGDDVFAAYELDAQLANALSRKIWLPSGGYLIIDKTEAMTVIDVNTGSFVGSGGNLEETVTKNNLEAAEEIVRQMRLRDIGGMIVVDFVDMVLQENRDLLLRRLNEFLAADRTRHKVSEVTSLGLVQITRKRLGAGLVETYSTTCEACDGRGIILHDDPVQRDDAEENRERRDHGGREGLKQARHEQEIRKRYEDSAIEDAPAPAQEDLQTAAAVAEPADATHGSDAGDTGDAGDDSDVYGIVARALTRAGEEDPDEPTGADYVADDVTEALLRGIVQPDAPAEPNESTVPQSEPQAGARGDGTTAEVETVRRRDRRGRRLVRRVTLVADQPAETADTADTAASAAGGSTEGAGDVVPAGDAAAAAAEEFARAKAEFERSPRRRRRVRGNSRSDVAPKAEDFGLDGESAGQQGRARKSRQEGRPAAPDHGAAATASAETPETPEEPQTPQTPQAPQVRSDRRGRRRVVRSAR
jgi:ribonuclease E